MSAKLTLAMWLKLQPGDKVSSSISGHVYEIVGQIKNPRNKDGIHAYETTEGTVITFSGLWEVA